LWYASQTLFKIITSTFQINFPSIYQWQPSKLKHYFHQLFQSQIWIGWINNASSSYKFSIFQKKVTLKFKCKISLLLLQICFLPTCWWCHFVTKSLLYRCYFWSLNSFLELFNWSWKCLHQNVIYWHEKFEGHLGIFTLSSKILFWPPTTCANDDWHARSFPWPDVMS
jgi:hypothetical protein